MPALRLCLALCLIGAIFQLDDATAQTSARKKPPHLFYSWIVSNERSMKRCGDLQWQGRVCAIAGAPTDADRTALGERWLREGFDPQAVARVLAYWADRVRSRRANGDRDLRDDEARKTPYRRLTTPQGCTAASQAMRPMAAACRSARLLCNDKPCDNASLPRRLPGEILVPMATAMGACGDVQATHEQCRIADGVTAAMRTRATRQMIRQGFHSGDVAFIFDDWKDAYDAAKGVKPTAERCAEIAKPALKKVSVEGCGSVFPDCQQYGYDAACTRFRGWRGRSKSRRDAR